MSLATITDPGVVPATEPRIAPWREMRQQALAESRNLRTDLPEIDPVEPPRKSGITAPVGCPACFSPTKGAARMRHVEAMDAAGMAHRWRRSILECERCSHGVLIEVNLIDLDNPGRTT